VRLGRPKTLLGLTLTGLLLLTLPLLVAVGHAVITLGRLAEESERVVGYSATVTLENQRIASNLTELERNGRQYLVLRDADLLALYEEGHRGLEQSLTALAVLPADATIRMQIRVLRDTARSVRDSLRVEPVAGTQELVIGGFRTMTPTAREIAQATRLLMNSELDVLQQSTRETQRTLAWQSAALVPGMIALVIFFAVLVGRPMRRVDTAIRELGQGRFKHPINVTGPRDIEALGRQLEWLRQRLAESTEEKNRFLRHMSHELKTPLANIREGTELLMDGAVGPLDTQQQEVTAILRDNGLKLQQLIENLLTFSAWQSKSLALELTDFDLKPLVFSVLSQHRLSIANRKIKLQVKITPLRIRADEGKLRLVIENLISNAVKFTPNGGTIHVGAGFGEAGLAIEVADTGPGVAEEDADRIFEAFYQGRRLHGGPVGGTGIGLSVVAECVEAHEGNVELVRDSEWLGAHFRVVLPVRAAHPRPALVVANG
jgi:two-component system sensor histidine kinase GlrK